MRTSLFYFLKRKYKEYLNYVKKANKDAVLGIVMVSSLVFTLVVTMASVFTPGAAAVNEGEVKYAEVHAAAITDYKEPVAMAKKETTAMTTSTTSTTSTTTTCSETTTSTTTTTMVTTQTTETTTEVVTLSETVNEVVYSGVGQYGYQIDPEEYAYLAEVIEHEGGNCPLYVQEHIGICLLNRVFVPGFADSVYGCKEQSGQYFSGYYPFSEETAELAKSMIAAYNSGADYWSQYCAERGMTCRTKFQRNDYCVPGTSYVTDDYDCTSGGFWFHMYYSE